MARGVAPKKCRAGFHPANQPKRTFPSEFRLTFRVADAHDTRRGLKLVQRCPRGIGLHEQRVGNGRDSEHWTQRRAVLK
jgi:hypothetical protein